MASISSRPQWVNRWGLVDEVGEMMAMENAQMANVDDSKNDI